MAIGAHVLLAIGAVSRRVLHIEEPADVDTTSYQDAYFERERELARLLIDRFAPSGRVLEIGCGYGGLLAELAGKGVAVVGIDIDEARVGYAITKGFDARVGDAQNSPFPDGSFDTIVSTAVLEHIPDIRAALREARRILAPCGEFVAQWGPAWLTYNGPHLIKALGVPWVHLFFSDRTILEALHRQRRVWPASYLDDKVDDFQSMGRLTRRKLREAAIAEGFVIVEEASRSPHRAKELLSRVRPFDELLAGELTVVFRRP